MRRKKIVRVAVSVLAVILALAGASLIILQTRWFSDFLRTKIVATLEDSTGGKVDIGSFRFDPWHLTARMRDLVLHGTEAANEEPLARVSLLELRLKFFSGLRKTVDIAYLGLEQPRFNLIVNPDGSTNVPAPKEKQATSNESPLATVVDLAVGEFRIDNGLINYAQTKTPLTMRGDNLRVVLDYSFLGSRYQGVIRIDPVKINAGNGQPLLVRVNLPLEIRKDGLSVIKGQLDTDSSHVLLSASLDNLNAPNIAATLSARVFLPDLKRAFHLPIAGSGTAAPAFLTADLDGKFDQGSGTAATQHFRMSLGRTTFEAAGTANPATGQKIHFSGNLALAELSQLLELSSPRVVGELMVNGEASLDRQKKYLVDGKINSRALALTDGATHLRNVSLNTPFHVTPSLIELNRLRVGVLGGELSANIRLEDLQKLRADGQVHNIALSSLTSTLEGQPIGYGGIISGSVKAVGDLQEPGTKGFHAYTRLSVTPARRGVPVNGLIEASYVGKNDSIDVKRAYLNLPASQINLSGAINKSLNVSLVSRNLNDFLPAVTFAGKSPATPLPIALQGGEAKLDARIQGNLSAPRVNAHAALTRFAAQNHVFDGLSFDLAASPSAAAVQNGVLRRSSMQAAFDGSIGLVKWSPVSRSPVSVNLSLRNGDLGDMQALAGMQDPGSRGDVEADIHVDGTYGDPLGSANVQISHGMAMGQPFDGLDARATLTDQLVTLNAFNLRAAGGNVTVNGTFRHPADRFTVGHTQIHASSNGVRLSQIPRLQQDSGGVDGVLALAGDVTADLSEIKGQTKVQISAVSADISANRLRIRNQDAGSLTANARTAAGAVIYSVQSNFAGSNINVDGHTSLARDYATNARATVRNLAVEKALQISGQGALPVVGLLAADASVSGTIKAPEATVQLDLTKANVYQEPIDRLTAKVQYKNDLLDLPLFDLAAPAGSINLSGQYAHPNGGSAGTVRVQLKSSDLDAAKVRRIQLLAPGIAGKLHMQGDLTASVSEVGGQQNVQLSNVDADLSANAFQIASRNLGDLKFSARTRQSTVTFNLDSDLAKSEIHATGTSQLAPDYPTRAEATFKNVRYENLAPLLSPDAGTPPPFGALVEGKVSVEGPILNAHLLSGRLELSRAELSSKPRSGSAANVIRLQNEQPIVMAFNRELLTLERFAMRGPETSLDASGSIDLANARNALHLNLVGKLNLGILQEVDRNFYSSGNIALNAGVSGTFEQPRLNGNITFHNANINYADAPNGLSNANGEILLAGNTATVRNLTGEIGGGKVEVAGSVGISPRGALYNLRTKATHVRSRYSGASITSSANVALTGSSRRSVLAGTVIVERIAYSSSSDIGSFLYTSSAPPSTPSEPSPLLSSMRLDVRITTASDLRVVTTYVDKLDLVSNLSVRGTLAQPGIVGRVNVTDGQLVFFGNTYTVNAGSIDFYDASAIKPELNLSLETVTQGVDVVLGVTGPVSNMKLSYHSDPPLTFEQIVQLLATNTTPFDPTIAAHQPVEDQQSLSQRGESEVWGQALANPLASRVQRVFGLTQFKIDPSVAGNNGQPTAKITLRQKITNNLTFTYITDVTQTNSEIVRVQFDLNSKASAVALRDYNGNVSLQLFYKFQVR